MNGDLHLVPRAPARPEQVLRSLELAVTRRLDGLRAVSGETRASTSRATTSAVSTGR